MTRAPRLQDWPQRLAEYVEGQRREPFAWGSNDCVTFAADAVEHMTGADPIAHLRGEWSTALEAARVIERLGGLREAVSDIWGAEIPPAYAQRGDWVLLEQEGRQLVGVCVGEAAAAPGDAGVVLVPMTAALAAWRT